jgi:hypothetical protein|tara:strand:- start:745 stop:900 length:156 start_codon:yes stop_codon:yes gene_type:complete
MAQRAVATSPNDMWSLDFMHDQLSDKRTIRHEWLSQYMPTDLAEMQDHATR